MWLVTPPTILQGEHCYSSLVPVIFIAHKKNRPRYNKIGFKSALFMGFITVQQYPLGLIYHIIIIIIIQHLEACTCEYILHNTAQSWYQLGSFE